MIRNLEIYSRDPDLRRRGPLPWESASITLSHLSVSTWSLTMDATAADRVAPGWGIIAALDQEQILTGSVEDPERERTSATSPGTITVSGADDMGLLAAMLAWPAPDRDIGVQLVADRRTGPAETVIKGYVDANVGTGRVAARRDPAAPLAREVTVAADLGRGPEISHRARFDPLLDVVRACVGESGLGISCQQQGDAIVFDVWETEDRPNAVFSHELGNLQSVRWRDAMPEATHAIVGGPGEGNARDLRRRSDSAAVQAWRMAAETFVDERSEEQDGPLNRAGDQALADARRAGIIEATLADTPRLRYGHGYGLGDRVTIHPEPGTAYTDQITSVTIDANRRDGTLTITPTVGWRSGGLYQTRQDREIAQLRRAVGALERSL
ncbi:siphovirus ReqiPepy6 Gp37-like family protein [Nocardiopsis ganjiahuensis]|uniref:siphovirus ReqiPepy6 Gp37-like family protein n=1 Tax=Nocardiopsis ganjiahuensis TaxID=239984 RepID=UPI000348BA42|nr:siphovirus ReqiPepy6 Gp37-like family protein [Nocardiopsis ganjiahuensis]